MVNFGKQIKGKKVELKQPQPPEQKRKIMKIRHKEKSAEEMDNEAKLMKLKRQTMKVD